MHSGKRSKGDELEDEILPEKESKEDKEFEEEEVPKDEKAEEMEIDS